MYHQQQNNSHSKSPRSWVPNLWPPGKKWPAKPQKVALD